MMKKQASINDRKRKRTIFVIALMAFPIAHYLVFWLYVNLQTIMISFRTLDVYTGGFNYGLSNFVTQWQDVFVGKNETMHNALINSFNVWGINAIILPLAVIASYAFHKKIPCEKFFRVIFYMPHMISVTTLTLCFRYLFENNSVIVGPIAYIFNQMGVVKDWWNVVDKSDVVWPLIYLYHIWFGLGANVILISGAMNRIPREVVEAGKLDGVGFWRELATVTIPLVMPTIGTFLLTSLTGVMSYGMIPMLLLGPTTNGGSYGQAFTMGWFMFNVAKGGSETQLEAATAIGVIFSVFMIPVVVIARKIINKLTPDVQY